LQACVAIWMLHIYCNDFSSVFSQVFINISDTCYKCFIYLQTYIVNVSSYVFGPELVSAQVLRSGQRWVARRCHQRQARAHLPMPLMPCQPMHAARMAELRTEEEDTPLEVEAAGTGSSCTEASWGPPTGPRAPVGTLHAGVCTRPRQGAK
jgi:hypothetical protein